jgi:lipid-A-disaccharide synthase
VAKSATDNTPTFGMVAGEASGDLLASLLLDAMRQRWPHFDAQGIGGPQMQAKGFKAQWPSEALSVFGFVDALKVYRSLSAIRQKLATQWIQSPPSLFIGIDAPDFNFGLERQLKSAGIKTLHVVCPSFWAWRPKRIDTLLQSADHVLCLFPFEPALLHPHGIKATFVGHPLASLIDLKPDKEGARQRLGLASDDTVVAVLPGSRASEIKYIAPAFLSAIKLLRTARPALKFVIPTVTARHQRLVELVEAAGLADHVCVVPGEAHAVLAAADVALMASGTATLEAALFKCPMVIAYKLSTLSWLTLKRLQLQPWVGLPNILAGEFIVPELLQGAASPKALADEVVAWLDNPQRVAAVKARFESLHLSLLQDTAGLACKAIQEMLND